MIELSICYDTYVEFAHLEKEDTHKYFGIHFTHIDKICAKSKKLIGMFHRKFFSAMDVDSCRRLYKAYIRPHLEYEKDINALERSRMFKNLLLELVMCVCEYV